MSANEEIRDNIGEAFDELRAEFFPGSQACLLKISDTANNWDVVLEVQGKWFF